jgi:GAF domain-containing protein
LQATDTFTTIRSDNPLRAVPGARSYICIPLWFKDNFEGTLAAIFGYVILSDGPEVQALVGSGTHIAAALAHSRLRAALESQHARLRAILDQLPEGVMLIEATSGCISYANLAASHILGVPLISLIDVPLNQYPHAPPATNPDKPPLLLFATRMA